MYLIGQFLVFANTLVLYIKTYVGQIIWLLKAIDFVVF